jgi:hypothetical protein
MLTEIIDRIDQLLSSGSDIAKIRAQLVPLREQTEAVEARVKELESQAQNSDFKQKCEDLQAQLDEANRKIAKLQSQTEDLEEDAIKILDTLFDQGDSTIEYIAEMIGIPRAMGEYHRDILFKKGFVQHTGIGFKGFGAMGNWVDTEGTIGLTELGRKFVVRLKQK